MPVDVSMYKESHIIYSHLYNIVTMEDIHLMSNLFRSFIDDADLVHGYIMDLRDVTEIPSHINDYKLVLKTWLSYHEHNFVIIIGAVGIARFIIETIMQLAHWEYRIADTLEDAEKMFNHVLLYN